MALVTCPDCEKQISDSAPACPQCGRPIAATPSPAAASDPPTPSSKPVLLGVLLLVLVLALGKIRVVSGTAQIIVPRSDFGYSDAFASLSDCTSGPYLAVMASHGPLCHDLQQAGELESDDSRKARIDRELNERMEQARRDVDAIIRRSR